MKVRPLMKSLRNLKIALSLLTLAVAMPSAMADDSASSVVTEAQNGAVVTQTADLSADDVAAMANRCWREYVCNPYTGFCFWQIRCRRF